ncbi:glycosyltransferase family 2 protein [Thalassoroseus pseudoceratinae]|uniref:glycosyltransferase family 2 protein n=1 Tax=Thalassoroseus pseudoceratinae TaxID=2713176 RepID=UPI0014232645|nr:glycosyltransferase family 2 protein [Thalassoroseus pseudoceratinae]
MSESPRVTIGLPVYNAADYLRPTIDSILAQTDPDWELIIADNASTDETLAICEEYMKSDSRIRLLTSEQNNGSAWNHNRCVAEARGEFFRWAGYDDPIAPDFNRRCIAALEADESIAIVVPRMNEIDSNGTFLRLREPLDAVDGDTPSERFRQVIYGYTGEALLGMIRLDILRTTRLEGLYAFNDYILVVELALRGKIRPIPETLLDRRIHAQAINQLHATNRSRAVAHNPKLAGKILFPHWREGRELWRTTTLAKLPFPQRWRSRVSMLRWLRRRAGDLSHDVLFAARQVLHRVLPGRKLTSSPQSVKSASV